MTEQTQPTDAELLPCPFCGTQPDECDIGQFVVECPNCAIVGPAYDNSNAAKRAWNTRWGTPAGAVEPWGACISGRVFVGKLPEHARKLAEADNLPIQWLYTTPQPTQSQAGAVPLTAKQMESGREAIFSTGNPYCPCDSKTFRKVAEWVERHHGIRGADHA